MPRGRPRKNPESGTTGALARINAANYAEMPGRIGRTFREDLRGLIADMNVREGERKAAAVAKLSAGIPVCHQRLVAEVVVGEKVGSINREVAVTLECGHTSHRVESMRRTFEGGQFWTHCRQCYGAAMRRVFAW